jgi:hypothetical protein
VARTALCRPELTSASLRAISSNVGGGATELRGRDINAGAAALRQMLFAQPPDGTRTAPRCATSGSEDAAASAEPADQQFSDLAHSVGRAGGHVEDEVVDADGCEFLDAGHELVGCADVGSAGIGAHLP